MGRPLIYMQQLQGWQWRMVREFCAGAICGPGARNAGQRQVRPLQQAGGGHQYKRASQGGLEGDGESTRHTVGQLLRPAAGAGGKTRRRAGRCAAGALGRHAAGQGSLNWARHSAVRLVASSLHAPDNAAYRRMPVTTYYAAAAGFV